MAPSLGHTHTYTPFSSSLGWLISIQRLEACLSAFSLGNAHSAFRTATSSRKPSLALPPRLSQRPGRVCAHTAHSGSLPHLLIIYFCVHLSPAAPGVPGKGYCRASRNPALPAPGLEHSRGLGIRQTTGPRGAPGLPGSREQALARGSARRTQTELRWNPGPGRLSCLSEILGVPRGAQSAWDLGGV